MVFICTFLPQVVDINCTMVSATAVKEVSATNGHTNGHAKDGINNGPPLKKAKLGDNLMATGRIYDYTSSANPDMPEMPVLVHPPSLHQTGESRVIPFDLSKQLGTAYAATSPNLMASYIRIKDNESVKSDAHATSQAFYIIRGEGCTKSEFGSIQWSQGDLFVIPMSTKVFSHLTELSPPNAHLLMQCNQLLNNAAQR